MANSCIKKQTHKCVIKVKTTVREVYDIKKKNGNDYWRESIIKEINNIYIAIGILEEGEWMSPMHSYMLCHTIFDTKMEFTRKSCFVASGCHATKYDERRYSVVVSCESVRIAFTYDALNGNYMMAYGLFQLHMRISIPFLRAKNLRTYLLIMKTCSFFNSPIHEGCIHTITRRRSSPSTCTSASSCDRDLGL